MKYPCAHCQKDLTDIVMALPCLPSERDQLVCHHCLKFNSFDRDLRLRQSTNDEVERAVQDPNAVALLVQMYFCKMSRKARFN